MILRPTPVSTDRFTYERATGIFAAELSDFGRGFRLGQVYDDACDVGLTLVSAKTGRGIVFSVYQEQRDRDGDLQWIDLEPADVRERGVARVRLYND